MNLVIVGYGRMGREVEAVAKARGHEIVARVDPDGGDEPTLTPESAGRADVAVEFSLPEAAVPNAELYSNSGLSAVVGTTGWYDRLDEVRALVEAGGAALIYGSNFSVGAHMYFRLVAHAARLINSVPDYDVLGYEIHHRRKKDSPSGTALSISDLILNGCDRKTEVVTEKLDRAILPHELHMASVRGGEMPGVHSVMLDSEADTIELRHTVRTRRGLALGAVMAAEWVQGKRGFFRVEEFIDDVFEK